MALALDLALALALALAQVIEELSSVSAAIAEQAIEHIHSNEVILTHGRDPAVEAFLKAAHKKRTFEVIVCETSPANEVSVRVRVRVRARVRARANPNPNPNPNPNRNPSPSPNPNPNPSSVRLTLTRMG